MPQYFSPGVFIEEVDSGPRPIQGVSTSVTGAVGVTERGPTSGKPVLVTSFSDFRRQFGGFIPLPDPGLRNPLGGPAVVEGGQWWRFAHAVQGFFANGGQQLFVKRVSSIARPAAGGNPATTGAVAASGTPLRGAVSRVTADATAGTSVNVDFVFGLQGATVRIINGADGSQILDANGDADFTVQSVVNGLVTFEPATAAAVPAGSYLSANQITFTAKNPGSWGNDLQLRIATTSAANLVLTTASLANATVIEVRGANRLYPHALIQITDGTNTETAFVVSVDGNNVTLASGLANPYAVNSQVSLRELSVNIALEVDGNTIEEEQFDNLRFGPADNNLSLVTAVNRRSALVTAESETWDVPDAFTFPAATALTNFPFVRSTASATPLALQGGVDNYQDLRVDDFIGVDGGSGQRTGIKALEDIEDISIVVVPAMWAPSIHSEMITHCEQLQYRVAILDPRPNRSIQEILDDRSPLDTSYAALYYPWLDIRDSVSGQNIEMAPSGVLAGIYARVDAERGVQKAPANEVVRSIAGFHQDVTRREQDLLNPDGINALRFFPGRGFRVWGARTVSSDANFRYISVRRTFNFIERSIDEGTQFVVFEPNTPQTWSRVRQSVNNFLNTQWLGGVLDGRTAEEAYFVECDLGVTMTQDDVEQGRLICEIGIAPVFPAEFVIFRIQKFTAESRLN